MVLTIKGKGLWIVIFHLKSLVNFATLGKKDKLFQGGMSEVKEGKAKNATKGLVKEEWFPWENKYL